MLTEQLKAWYLKFQKYKVKYKNGFFHLSNLANSPHTIVESIDKMAFVKHIRAKKQMTSNTLFLKVSMYYAEIEEDLWVIVSDMKIKRSFVMQNIIDETLPQNYNFINLHYNQKSVANKSMLIDGMMLTDKTWTVFKAGGVKFDYHFKDAHEYNITVYFTNDWLASTFKSLNIYEGSNLEKFIRSNSTSLFLPDMQLDSNLFYEDFLALIEQNGDYSNNSKIKAQIIKFFSQFIEKYELEPFKEQHFKLSDKDRKYVRKAEKFISDNLLSSFPSIDTIASHVGVSPSKLKADFKTIHNQSLFNYFRYHQMELANKLFTQKNITVREVANLLGYENASKFAAAFKEQFGVSPSSVVKNHLQQNNGNQNLPSIM